MTLNSEILDWPRLPDNNFVIWHWNGVTWPDGRRSVIYLTDKKQDVMRGYALFTPHYQEAATFDTKELAQAFIAENDAKRPHPYGDLRVTVVAELRRVVQYPASPMIERKKA